MILTELVVGAIQLSPMACSTLLLKLDVDRGTGFFRVLPPIPALKAVTRLSGDFRTVGKNKDGGRGVMVEDTEDGENFSGM